MARPKKDSGEKKVRVVIYLTPLAASALVQRGGSAWIERMMGRQLQAEEDAPAADVPGLPVQSIKGKPRSDGSSMRGVF